MKRQFAKLQCIDCNEEITDGTHGAFLFHLQNALLLALREQGRLNPMQHRHAEEQLNRQRRDRAKRLLDSGEEA